MKWCFMLSYLPFLLSARGDFLFLTSCYNQVSRSSSVPSNTRDALYQGLPPSIKSSLRSKLLSFQVKEEVCILYTYYKGEICLYVWSPCVYTCGCRHLRFVWVENLLQAKLLPSFNFMYLLIHNLPQMVFLQLTIPQIKAEMEKTLQWLVPIATNTTK